MDNQNAHQPQDPNYTPTTDPCVTSLVVTPVYKRDSSGNVTVTVRYGSARITPPGRRPQLDV